MRGIIIGLTAALLLPVLAFAEPVAGLNEGAIKLFQSLTPEQRKAAVLPFDNPERDKEVFPGGKRPGIQLKSLTDEQRAIAMSLLTQFTSDYGKAKCISISEQTKNNPPDDPGIGRYYLVFFGEPGAGKTYAWRIAEHHLTLVHMEIDKGEIASFGPILAGSDPPEFFHEEQDKLIALYAAMTPDEQKSASNPGKGVASFKFEGHGIKIGDLKPSAHEAAKAAYENRLKFFSEPIQARIKSMVDKQGGLDAMQIAFYNGAAEKRCADGGRWDFKMVGPSFLCDFETSRQHIHMSLKGKMSDKTQ